jgi:bifunctional ADP-heptose synthase (sugar kinase/adenylyltransferase)
MSHPATCSINSFSVKKQGNAGIILTTFKSGDASASVAGFLAALSRGESLPGCVQIGNGAGAKCVERLGSSGTLPAYQELISFTGLHRE